MSKRELEPCCGELTNFLKEVLGDDSYQSFPIGEGEISGAISVEIAESGCVELRLEDGWAVTGRLSMRYCPSCGKPLKLKTISEPK